MVGMKGRGTQTELSKLEIGFAALIVLFIISIGVGNALKSPLLPIFFVTLMLSLAVTFLIALIPQIKKDLKEKPTFALMETVLLLISLGLFSYIIYFVGKVLFP